MTWAVLCAWLAVYPIVGWRSGLVWQAHVASACLLGLAAAHVLWRRAAVPRRAPALATGVAVVSLMVALAVAPAEWPRREMQWAALTGLAHALFFVACLVVMPGADAPEDEARRARVRLAALLVAVLAGQAGWVLFGPTPDGDPPRPEGTLGNPNALATVVAACGLALFGLAGSSRAALLIALPIVPLVLVTRSRGAVLAAGLTLLILALRHRRRRLLAAAAVAAALLLVVPNPLRERMLAMRSSDVFSRPYLWGAALENAAAHPLGIGPAMNRYVFPVNAEAPDRPWLLFQRHGVGLTHNVFLTLTLEWGWLAGAALVSLLALTAARLAGRPPGEDRLRTGAALGAAVMLFELQVDGLEQNAVAFSLFLLFAAVVWARLPAPTRGTGVSGRALAALLLVAVTLMGGALAVRWRGLLRLDAAQDALAAFAAAGAAADDDGTATVADADAVRAALVAAEEALPGDPVPPRLAFDFEHERVRALVDAGAPEGLVTETAEAAWAAFDRARAANGLDPTLPADGARLAVFLWRRADKDPSLLDRQFELLEESLRLDPLDVEGHFRTAQEALRAGREDLMRREAGRALELEPDYAYAWFVLARLDEAVGRREEALYAYVRAEEAVLNCHLKARVAHPSSRAFYVENLEQTDLAVVRERIVSLRRELYF